MQQTEMTYAAAVDFLYNQLPMFSRIGVAAYKKDLTNTLLLCEYLGHPQKKLKTIHVAGTNGKGSVSHMMAAVLQQNGYKTGLYTSPHLTDFRERIKINGQVCSESFVIKFVERVRSIAPEINPSFFEISVAMAFTHFAEENVDIAVIETGLGGRLDSTNIIHPELSIITNIGWDHMSILGNTLPQIAFEKAGIIKKNTPIVIGETQLDTQDVFISYAEQQNTICHFADQKFKVIESAILPNGMSQFTILSNGKQASFTLDLGGLYQSKNLCTVLCALQILEQNGWDISENSISTALAQVKKLNGLHGRWEQVMSLPTVILDVAHNEPGMREVIKHLSFLTYQTLHIIIGMVKDKEIKDVLSLLPVHAMYYFTQANIPRALPADELAGKAASHQLSGSVFSNVNDALKNAVTKAVSSDLILVCGSVFLIGEVDRNIFKKD
jgi:dihydrofolate synthase/folylpolyglutamate synthase